MSLASAYVPGMVPHGWPQPTPNQTRPMLPGRDAGTLAGIPVIISRHLAPGTVLLLNGSYVIGEQACPVCHIWAGACRTRRGHKRHDHRARNRRGQLAKITTAPGGQA